MAIGAQDASHRVGIGRPPCEEPYDGSSRVHTEDDKTRSNTLIGWRNYFVHRDCEQFMAMREHGA
jgi:hypothetical protein